MPDANGKFKGISVPELPWVVAPSVPEGWKRNDKGELVCLNPNCQFCAQTKPERSDS